MIKLFPPCRSKDAFTRRQRTCIPMTGIFHAWAAITRASILRAGACLLLFAVPLAAAGADADAANEAADPGHVVHILHDKLVEAMKTSAQLGYAGRYRELEPIVAASFDTPLIVKVILSRYWDELKDEQKNAFIALFGKLSTATYASRFKDYDGEQFVEVAREELKNERMMIRTELRRPDESPVKLDYLLQRDEKGQWLIINVIADGVSDLSLKRAEYAVVIKERGFDSLVEDIEKKIKQFEADTQK